MYSSKLNVQLLISLLKQFEISEVVIAPGSRNLSLTMSFDNDDFFRCHSVVDERSASYYATGLSRALGAPVVVVCTSAQATRNLIPGLTQAFYQGSQVIAVTADWPAAKIGQGVMQTLDQMSMPSDAVKHAVNLPEVNSSLEKAHCARLINEALLSVFQEPKGPVQINTQIDNHWDGGTNKLVKAQKIELLSPGASLPRLEGKKVMLLIGEHEPFATNLEKLVEKFVEKYDAVLLTNHLSNLNLGNYQTPRSKLSSVGRLENRELWPDVLITIGGQHGDYEFDAMLNRIRFSHWDVRKGGRVRDTYQKLTKIFDYSEEDFFNEYFSVQVSDSHRDSSYRQLWFSKPYKPVVPVRTPLSHVVVANSLHHKLPESSVIHFGILTALRVWQHFPLAKSVSCYANVAGFGIDGSMSSFIGHSMATEEKCFLVVGDLSFFYDMNVLGLRQINENVRIILVNNGGGGEFRQDTNAAEKVFGDRANSYVAAVGHYGSAEGWAKSVGFDYLGIEDIDEMEEATAWIVKENIKPMLLEITVDLEADVRALKIFRDANLEKVLEKRISTSLPENLVSKIKKRLS